MPRARGGEHAAARAEIGRETDEHLHVHFALGEEYVAWFPAERARRKILFRSILRDSPTARALVARNRELLRQSKFIRGGDWRTEINIYGSKVALFSFRAATPFCVLVEDADLAETFRVAWHALWDRLEGPVVG